MWFLSCKYAHIIWFFEPLILLVCSNKEKYFIIYIYITKKNTMIELRTKKNKTIRIERIRKSHIPHRINKRSGERPNLYKKKKNVKENILTWTRVTGHNPILYNVLSNILIFFHKKNVIFL